MREVTIEEQASNVDNMTFGDDRLGVVFYTRVVEDAERTQAEGRRCFREREYIKIMVPGDRYNTIDRPVQTTGTIPTDDRLRFAKQYERFKQQKQQTAHEGTPLSLWPAIPGPLAEELRFLNIFSVEQLAGLADTYVSKLPMGQSWKQRAQEFLAALKDQEAINKLNAQLTERDTRIDALEKAIADQAEQIRKLLSKKG
jgi:hypothetical protein